MKFEIDSDVMAALTFMQRNIPAARLVAVAEAAAKLAPIIWSHYKTEDVDSLRLREDPITATTPAPTPSSPTTPTTATIPK